MAKARRAAAKSYLKREKAQTDIRESASCTDAPHNINTLFQVSNIAECDRVGGVYKREERDDALQYIGVEMVDV